MPKKHKLSITDIEDKLKLLVENLDEKTFIEDFLRLYDIPKTSITRAKSKDGDFFIRNKVRFRKVDNKPLQAIDEMEQEISNQNKKPRFIIATDYKMFYAKDTKTNDSLAINFEDLPASAEFFLSWNGIERIDYQKESPADIKAAERFTKLYDELVHINSELAKEEIDGKSFNLFLIRSLFLYFSEDTEIIPKGAFTNALKTRSKRDGSDLNSVIKELFSILNVPEDKRNKTPEWLQKFPYVNGKLFEEPHHDLHFNTLTRKLLIEAGELLKWNEINPDILGSMIQTVANKEERQVSGMHYTSVSNISKVIRPLFLNSLKKEYQRLSDRADSYLDRDITNEQRRKQQRDIILQLEKLINRMSRIKFLDPACGSGNFLIITYKELRRLEIDCLVKIREIREALDEKNVNQGAILKQSKIKLNQFSGIEIDDFAHDVAQLSLYIAEHQMNNEMTDALADYQPKILPLQESGNIVRANALLIDWNDVLLYNADDELYIMGNPPYKGSKRQSKQQKKEIDTLFLKVPNYKQLDYISGWFIKAAKFIHQTNFKFAFVTTNSINQGQQVSILWNQIFKYEVEISFAYTSFKWINKASNNAVVTVSIVGMSPIGKAESKYLFDESGISKEAKHINAYLVEGENVIVEQRGEPLADIPPLIFGSMPNDGGGLLFKYEDYEKFIFNYPNLQYLFKKFLGAQEYIDGTHRYALWLDEKEYQKVKDHPILSKRFEKVKLSRLGSKRKATKKLASLPYKFGECRYKELQSIIIPAVSSEDRDYVPMGFVNADTVISNRGYVIYNAPIWLLGILVSRIHMVWFRSVGGKLETRYSYSAGMVYNTFPIPSLSTQRKNLLEEAVLDMLDVREEEGGTLAELYGGANKPMNARLREAHEKIDGIVERAYKQDSFKSDEERLSVLLKLYQKMTSEEK